MLKGGERWTKGKIDGKEDKSRSIKRERSTVKEKEQTVKREKANRESKCDSKKYISILFLQNNLIKTI